MAGLGPKQADATLDRLACSRVARFGLLLVLAASIIAIAHGGAIRRNFGNRQWEDSLFINHEKEHIHSVADSFWNGSRWAGLYRPISTNLYYHIGRRAFGHDAKTYNCVSAIMFLINILLAFWVCRSLAGYWFSLAAALLFGSRFSTSEVPLYASQMQSILPVFFSLLALKAYLAGLEQRCNPALMVTAAFMVLAALFSKESMVTLPFFCLLLALLPKWDWTTHKSTRRRICDLALAGMPFVALLVWWCIARDFLRIGNNPWWKYEMTPLALAGNGVAYLLSFSNAIMWQMSVPITDPSVPGMVEWLPEAPLLSWAHDSMAMQLLFLALVAAVSVFLSAVIIRRRWRPPGDMVLAALGFALFVCVTFPMLVFKDHLLSYYGYFGHLGISITLVGLARPLVLRAGSGIRRKVRRAIDDHTDGPSTKDPPAALI